MRQHQFKKTFPNESAVRDKLTNLWDDDSATKIKNLKVSEDSDMSAFEYYVSLRNKIIICVGLLIVISFFVNAFTLLLITLYLIVIYLGILLFKWYRFSPQYIATVNEFLFPKLFSVFDLEGEHTHVRKSSQLKNSIIALLDDSQLITEPRNRTKMDNYFITKVYNTKCEMTEMEIKHVSGSGKNRQVKRIFKGIFVSYQLPVVLEGRTFISTRGDSQGFGHTSFWRSVTGGASLQETKMEWNQFNKQIRVATTNPTEARYILTPAFMSDLYDWWHEKKVNIRISFIADHMYILFPDRTMFINQALSPFSLDTKKLQDYVMKTAVPFMHTLHLIEDIRVRFR